MADLPYFKFYAFDWLSSHNVLAMTLEEEGAFIRLLAIAWSDPDCGISADEARLSKLTKGRWKRVRDAVLPMFEPHPTVPGKLINPRLYGERRALEEQHERNVQNGSRGGRKKAENSKPGSSPPTSPPTPNPLANDNPEARHSEVRSQKSESEVREREDCVASQRSGVSPGEDTPDAGDRPPPIVAKVRPQAAKIDRDICRLWNEVVAPHGPPAIRDPDIPPKSLQRNLPLRRKEHPRREDLAYWGDAFRKLVASPFLMGKTDRRPRPFDLPEVCMHSTILEGLDGDRYRDLGPRAPPGKPTVSSKVMDWLQQEEARDAQKGPKVVGGSDDRE